MMRINEEILKKLEVPVETVSLGEERESYLYNKLRPAFIREHDLFKKYSDIDKMIANCAFNDEAMIAFRNVKHIIKKQLERPFFSQYSFLTMKNDKDNILSDLLNFKLFPYHLYSEDDILYISIKMKQMILRKQTKDIRNYLLILTDGKAIVNSLSKIVENVISKMLYFDLVKLDESKIISDLLKEYKEAFENNAPTDITRHQTILIERFVIGKLIPMAMINFKELIDGDVLMEIPKYFKYFRETTDIITAIAEDRSFGEDRKLGFEAMLYDSLWKTIRYLRYSDTILEYKGVHEFISKVVEKSINGEASELDLSDTMNLFEKENNSKSFAIRNINSLILKDAIL